MNKLQFKKNRSISTDGRDVEEFGSLNNFLQIDDQFTQSIKTQKNQLSFLQSPLNKTHESNQLNLFSTLRKRNSFSLNQNNLKSGQSSTTNKANPVSLYDTYIKENSNNKFDKIPLDITSPKIMSVKEKKEGIIQKLFERMSDQLQRKTLIIKIVGNEQLKPMHKRNSIQIDKIDECQYEKRRSNSLAKQSKFPLCSLNNSPSNIKSGCSNRLINYKQIQGKTFAYENYVKGLVQLKEKSIETKEFSQNAHLYDNFIEEKVDKSYPIILGLSSNYKTLANATQSLKEHDYKRHKMKKSQYLVRTAVKYIENQREHESLSNYDKSFHRLKGVVVQGRQNGKLNQNPEFSKGDVEIINRYRQERIKIQDEEQKKNQKNQKSPKEGSVKQKNISSLESDDDSLCSINSETRRFQEKQNEVKDKIMQEILSLKDKMSKKAIQRKYFSQSKAENFIRYQQVLDWAKIHDKDKLESFQNFEKKVQQIKSVSSPQKQKENQEGEIPFKSQEIMQRVLELDKLKQSNKIRSTMVRAKNKITNTLTINKLLNTNNLFTPNKNEISEFYDYTTGSPKQQFQGRSIFSRNKAISISSEQDIDLNGTEIKNKLTNLTPKQQKQYLDCNSVSTSSQRKESLSFTKQEEKNNENPLFQKIANNIDYQKIFINGLEDVINDIHKGSYL